MSNNHHDSSHGSVKSYIVGFILSIILTVIPYYLVVHHAMAFDKLVITVMAIAILQLLVQVIYFLHLSFKGEEYGKTLSFIFTLVVVFILVGGTIWIMWSLYERMMPNM